jgi:hypothetical protein
MAKFGKDTPRVKYTRKGKAIADWTRTAPAKVYIQTRAEPRFQVITDANVEPKFKVISGPPIPAAPDLDHLKRENAIPATPPQPNAEPRTRVVDLDEISPEQREKAAQEYRDWRRRRNVKDALESQDPRAEKTTNASLHVVDTPGGRAKYHAARQRAALEIAKGLKGSERKFALQLARHHGAEKRKAGGVDQKRVPAGQPTGGRWTK